MNMNPFDNLVKRSQFSLPAEQVIEQGYLQQSDYYVYLPDSETQVLTLTARMIQVVDYEPGAYLDDEKRVGKLVVTTVKVFDALVIDPITCYIATVTLRSNQLLCVEH